MRFWIACRVNRRHPWLVYAWLVGWDVALLEWAEEKFGQAMYKPG